MTHTLLVTFDLSPFGEHIIDTALRMAAATNAQVYLLHVVPPGHAITRGAESYDAGAAGTLSVATGHSVPPSVRLVESATQASDRLRNEAMTYLERVARRFPAGIAHPEVRVGEHPSREIVQAATELGANAILMATHGRSALAHVVLGSVAAGVVRTSTIPVLVQRPRDMPRHPEHDEVSAPTPVA
ncbi:MAG: universal stress protein [Dehalococcoidia bacterium]